MYLEKYLEKLFTVLCLFRLDISLTSQKTLFRDRFSSSELMFCIEFRFFFAFQLIFFFYFSLQTFDLFDIFVLILQVKAGERQGVPLASTSAPALAQSCGCERWRGLLPKAQ